MTEEYSTVLINCGIMGYEDDCWGWDSDMFGVG